MKRRRHARQLAQLPDRRHQRVELDGLAGFHILQHRRLERAELARDGVAIFGLLVDGDAQALTDLFRFDHYTGDKAAHQVVVHDQVRRGTGERADRVDRHVAPELEPDVFLNLAGHRRFKAGFFKQRCQLQQAVGFLARWFANDQFVAEVMSHQPGLVHRTTGMHHAADHVRRGYRRRQRSVRVHRDQPRPRKRTTEALQKPPRHAIHRGEHDGVWPDQRCDLLRDVRQRRRFHAQYHQVLDPDVCGRSTRYHRLRRDAFTVAQPQSVLVQRVERGPARHHADAAARTRQAVTDPAADRACAINTNFHELPCLSQVVL